MRVPDGLSVVLIQLNTIQHKSVVLIQLHKTQHNTTQHNRNEVFTMEKITAMKSVLNDFIKSLPDFMERSKKSDFALSGIRMIVCQDELTATDMEQWCNLMVKHGIPFNDGLTRDFHNDMYLGWKTRFTMIYLSAHYIPYKFRNPLELSWCMLTIDTEVKDGEHDEI